MDDITAVWYMPAKANGNPQRFEFDVTMKKLFLIHDRRRTNIFLALGSELWSRRSKQTCPRIARGLGQISNRITEGAQRNYRRRSGQPVS